MSHKLPIHFEVVEPAPSTKEFLHGAWIYGVYVEDGTQARIRLDTTISRKSSHLYNAPVDMQLIPATWRLILPVATDLARARIDGEYVGVGSVFKVF